MSSFDITQVYIEIVVGEEIEDSSIITFRHLNSHKDFNSGILGSWLVDLEDEVEFPKEVGKYSMKADWNDSSEIIESIYDIQRL